jgi:hypothetical protein
MDTQIKTKWIEALRSGEFKQAQNKLQQGDGYCCLGVLCRVADLTIDAREDTIIVDGYVMSYDALSKFGLTETLRAPLISMNDSGKTFSDIAAYIEANL